MTYGIRRAGRTSLLIIGAALVAAGCGRGSEDPQAPVDPVDEPEEIVITPALIERNNRAVGLMGQYAYGPALEIFEKLAAEQPQWSDVQVNLAIATLNRQEDGDEAAAMEMLAGVIDREPDHLAARYMLALLQYRNGLTEEALGHLSFVVERDPDDGYAWYFLGQCLEQQDAERALHAYRRARELEPYLRSAYFRAAAVLRMTEMDDEADQELETFQVLDGNPRARTARFIYSEMGAKANAIVVGAEVQAAPARPDGPALMPPRPLLADDPGDIWSSSEHAGSITVCDIDGDGRLDIFIADALRSRDDANAVIMQNDDGSFRLDRDHILAKVTAVRAGLWGDIDNDGMVDVYLCRRGSNQLFRRSETGWENITRASGTGGDDLDTVDGVLADLDHDGDLDIFCVNADGPDELFMNNLDGTFRAIAQERGLAGDDRPSRGVLVADFDGSRDLDIMVIKDAPPHAVYMNDRLWNWQRRPAMRSLEDAPVSAALAMDVDVDGRPTVFTMAPGGEVAQWKAGAETIDIVRRDRVAEAKSAFALLDLRGDGEVTIVLPGAGGQMHEVPLQGPVGAPVAVRAETDAWAPALLDLRSGWSIITRAAGAAPMVQDPGPGRHEFTAMIFAGRDDPGNSMRTNASGIGTRAFARRGSHWTPVTTIRPVSLPGQSLQPWPVGLGGAAALDFVLIDWPDGIFQTEVRGGGATPADGSRSFGPGDLERIAETQRQVSSCPVIFAWDGEEYVFVSDLLGVGGIGYLLAPGHYATPRPWEHFMLPAGLPAPKDGRLVLKLTEPMEEATYMDQLGMVAYDLPPGWSMVLDERMATGEPQVTGRPHFYRVELQPVRASVAGREVTAELMDADFRAVCPGTLDRRFMGRLDEALVIELHFGAPLDEGPGQPVLMIDGWVEYAYSQTMFSAWQANAGFKAPTLEAKGADGVWTTVLERFGYPGGMPRRMSVPLPPLPAGTTALRLSTNQEIYFDRISVIRSEPCSDVVRHPCPLVEGMLSIVGFPNRTEGPQRRPLFDYADRSPFWDVRYQRGWYTREGSVTPLLKDRDDAVAIFGPGEELHLEFAAPEAEPAEGWTRIHVLEAYGWCKDMDLFTRDGETIAPLPMVGEDSPARQRLHRLFHTRFESGRSHR